VLAARDRFLKDGVDGASLRSIAHDARTSIGMIYYYFPSKDDLFLAVVEQVYEKVLADMAAALEPDVPMRERLGRLFERIGQASDEEVLVARLVAREALTSSARRLRLLERFMRGHVPLIARAVADGLLDGSLDRSRHPFVLMGAALGVGVFPQVARRALGERLPFPDAPAGAEFAKELVDVLFNGIGAKPKAT
jgi:AcrR family transcriptional regulator